MQNLLVLFIIAHVIAMSNIIFYHLKFYNIYTVLYIVATQQQVCVYGW